tara:strand:+ start:5531 stop:5716 length:186 start_codon:yes stop_codon:yes gene_type:complete
MNKYIMILLAFIFFNGFISLLNFSFPTLPMDKIFPIQLWGNALFLFAFLLPQQVAPFLLKI